MIKLRIWNPLPYSVTLHDNVDLAILHFWSVYEEYHDKYPERDNIKVEDVLDMFQLTDMTVIKAVEARIKRNKDIVDPKLRRRPV